MNSIDEPLSTECECDEIATIIKPKNEYDDNSGNESEKTSTSTSTSTSSGSIVVCLKTDDGSENEKDCTPTCHKRSPVVTFKHQSNFRNARFKKWKLVESNNTGRTNKSVQHEIVNFRVTTNKLLVDLLNIHIPATITSLPPRQWLMLIVKRFQKQVQLSQEIIRNANNSSREAIFQFNKLDAFVKASVALLTGEYAALQKIDNIIERTLGYCWHDNVKTQQKYGLFQTQMIEFSVNHFNETYKVCVALLKA